MLRKIGFDENRDELIIAGDIVDRGRENFEMLEYAASKPKGVTFLMGNHDEDFIFYCDRLLKLFKEGTLKGDPGRLFQSPEQRLLFSVHVIDHYDTVRMLLQDQRHGVTLEHFRRWKDRMSTFPYYECRIVGGRRYVIVHAGYISERKFLYELKKGRLSNFYDVKQFYTWAREEGLRYGGVEGATVIFGHTPTIAESLFFNRGKVFVKKLGNRRFINIDCGCVFREWSPEADLACIRLDDEKIFYLHA